MNTEELDQIRFEYETVKADHRKNCVELESVKALVRVAQSQRDGYEAEWLKACAELKTCLERLREAEAKVEAFKIVYHYRPRRMMRFLVRLAIRRFSKELTTAQNTELRFRIAARLIELETLFKPGTVRLTFLARNVTNPKAHCLVTEDGKNDIFNALTELLGESKETEKLRIENAKLGG